MESLKFSIIFRDNILLYQNEGIFIINDYSLYFNVVFKGVTTL